MYKLETNKTWQIFQKACSLVLLLTFSSYVLPVPSYASDSTNYRLSAFALSSCGEKETGLTYDSNINTFGEPVNGDLKSANIQTQSGFLPVVTSETTAAPPAPPAGGDHLSESANFAQVSYLLSIASLAASSAHFCVPLSCMGEPTAGVLENYYDKTFSGHIYTLLGNPPVFKQDIPSQSWPINTAKLKALDLDDYFIDPDKDQLSFSVNGNAYISVNIDPITHEVSFSQNAGFLGQEEIIITAMDAEGNRALSHPITLNVFNNIGRAVNNAPVLDFIPDITAKEGQAIKIVSTAKDPNGNAIAYSFTAPFNSQGEWQTNYQSAGTYLVTVTASDGSLTDTQKVQVTVLNVNRKPTLNYIPDITGGENQLLTITPTATDPDGDDLTFSFSSPFNAQGQWLPAYQDSGTRKICVTVSDGSLTDSQDVLVNVANVNTTPLVSISLDCINAAVNEEVAFTVNVSDADGDPLTLILQNDGSQFYSGSVYEFYVGATSFSSLGIHTIKAIVQDIHGGQVQTTSNVEIIAPQELWNKVLPLLGDFNGDGLVDVGTYDRTNGHWAVALSNFGGFGSVTEWLTNFGASTDWQYVNGDFNGDGKTDIAIFNQSNGQWKAGISNSAGFDNQGVWATFSNTSTSTMPITGDFNGDGVSDVGVYNKAAGNVTVAISNKSSFTSASIWINSLAYSSAAQVFTGDFNGDGLIDIGVFNDGNWSFAVSDGTQFISKSEWDTSFGVGKTPVISDFNHDGLTDIGVFTKDTGLWQIYRCTGNGFLPGGDWLNNFGQGEWNSVYALDFNGDGLTDAACFDNSTFTWQRLAAQGKAADLLRKLTNSLGGTTEITYTPSVAYDNTGDDDQCDLPFVIQTVSKVMQSDGLGNAYQTNYSYANGLYASQERETRGFGYVKVTDSEGNISETRFKQDDIFKGLPDKTRISDYQGHLYLETEKTYDYTTPYTGVTFAYLKEEKSSTYDGQIAPQVTKTIYEEYDSYGNPAQIKSLGDVDISGDERQSNIEYVYNPALGILGLPCYTCLKDAQGKIVGQKWLYYDNHPNYTDTPVKGDLTREESWLDTADKTNPVTQKSYDDYGNVLTTTDARNQVSSITYDTVSHTYPVTITNHLGQTVSNTYDPKTGQILTSTDPNGQTSANKYDIFGRLLQAFGPNDNAAHPSAWYEYDLTTHPAKITACLREEENTDNADKIRVSYSFIDGLGRTIQTKTESDQPAKQIVSGIAALNSKGLLKHKYLPYLTNKTAQYTPPDFTQPRTTYEYDCLSRTVKFTNPDLTVQTVEYLPGIITSTDENGHKIRKYQDACGQTVKVEEFNQGKTYATAYNYDVQGNLVKTTDAQGNVTSITYDSLGRKLSMDTPDMGSWSYDYDPNGNLIKQTDAQGQVLEFEYDALNRLIKKYAGAGTLAAYIYDDTAKSNCIGRLSKVIDQSGSTEFFYDNLGREIKSVKIINGQTYSVQRAYDALDRLKSLTYPDGEVVAYTYTPSGGIKSAAGNQTYVSNASYAASGQMTMVSYGNNTHTDYTYNPQNLRLQQLTTNDGALQNLSYTFDNAGNIQTITDACHSATQSFAYDDLNRLTSAISQTYGTKTYCYDAIGNILEKEGISYAYGENGSGAHAVTTLTNKLTNQQTSLTYNANGNMLSKGIENCEYDLENRLTKVHGPITQSVSASYELTLHPGWNYISLPLIAQNSQISAVFSGLNFGSDYDQVSRYNPAKGDFDNYNNTSYNQFDTLEYGKGYLVYLTKSSDVKLTVTGQLADSQVCQLKTGWNLIGAPSTQKITVSAALNNLQPGLDYDKIVRYNNALQLFETISSADLLNPGEACYLHCLKDTTWKTPAEQQTTTFIYDGDGGRVKQQRAKGIEQSETTYVGSLFEKDSDGTTRKHIFLGSTRVCTVSTPVSSELPASSCIYYHPDHIGSSSIVTDGSGQQIQRVEYTPYGTTAKNEGTNAVKHKFTGKELDDTGLYYYGARYYDPELGRFITPDTIVQAPYDPQSLNRYSYCRNNPVNYVDPTGHFWFVPLIIAAVKGAIIGAAIGAAVSAATGGDIGKGAITGAISGAIFGGIGSFGLTGTAHTLAHTLGGAASGAANGAITGGDIGMNALIGGFSAGGSEWLGTNIGFLKPVEGRGMGAYMNNMLRRTFIGSVMGGATSAAFGGDFGYGARQGALTSAIAYSTNDWLHDVTEKLDFVKKGKELVPQAFEAAKGSKLPGDSSGPQDAYRHAMWNELMRKEMGPLKAFIVSMSHEIFENQVTGEQSWNDFRMDTHNNFQGAFSGKDAMSLYGEGKLKVLKNPTSEYKSGY